MFARELGALSLEDGDLAREDLGLCPELEVVALEAVALELVARRVVGGEGSEFGAQASDGRVGLVELRVGALSVKRQLESF